MAESGEEDIGDAAEPAPGKRLRAPSLGPAWSLSVIVAAVKAEEQDSHREATRPDVGIRD